MWLLETVGRGHWSFLAPGLCSSAARSIFSATSNMGWMIVRICNAAQELVQFFIICTLYRLLALQSCETLVAL